MKFIQSSENPLFRRLLALRDSGRERREEGATLIEGAHLIDAYIENNGKVPGMIVLDEHSLERSDLRDLVARVPDAPLVTFRSNLFAKISPVAGGNAVLAVIPIGETSFAETLAAGAFQLWLDGVQDPGNVGSIIRSAAASGAKAIILGPGCADPWSPKCLRAGMGGQFAIAVTAVEDLVAAAEHWHGRILVADGEALPSVFSTDLAGDVAIVLGCEGTGVGVRLKAQADATFGIPMPGSVESLNVSAAGAVICFERLRQSLERGRENPASAALL